MYSAGEGDEKKIASIWLECTVRIGFCFLFPVICFRSQLYCCVSCASGVYLYLIRTTVYPHDSEPRPDDQHHA